MNTLTKLAINKKISAIFADGTSKMNLGVSSVVGLLSGVDRVPVEVATFSRSSKAIAGLVAVNEEPVVEPESVSWLDMTDEQRTETIAGDEVEVIASVEPIVEAPEVVEAVEQVAQAFQELAPKAKAPKAKVTKSKVVEAPTVKKYQTLGTIFFSGSPTGQLLSVFKTRES